MHTEIEITFREHAPFLRRLATALLRDAAEAEDVVQDVLALAIQRRGAPMAAPRAWLAKAVRHRSINLLRRRRGVDLGAIGDPEAIDADPQTVALRLERERILHGELEALHEPYRTALFLRYRDGRTVREIASAVDVSTGTIESRLHRGRELLRSRLERRFPADDGTPGWVLGLTPLLWAPIGRSAHSAASSAGRSAAGLGSSSSAWVIGWWLGALLLATGLLALLRFGLSPSAAEPSVERLTAAVASAGSPALEALAAPAQDRAREVPVEVSTPVTVAEPNGALRVDLSDMDGGPLQRVTVLLQGLAPGHSPGPTKRALTGESGVVTFRELSPGTYRLRPAFASMWNSIDVAANETARYSASYGVKPSVVHGIVRHEDGTPAEAARVWRTNYDGAGTSADPVATADALGRFEVPICGDEGLQATLPGFLPSKRHACERLAEEQPGVRYLELTLGAKGARLSGVVLGEHDRPLLGAIVVADERATLGFERDGTGHAAPVWTRTNADGRFEIPRGFGSGDIELRVRSEGYGDLVDQAVRPGRGQPIVVRLQPEGTVHGTVVDPAGRPALGAVVWAEYGSSDRRAFRPQGTGSFGPVPPRMAVCGPDGAFHISGLAPGVTRLRAWHALNAFGAEATAEREVVIAAGQAVATTLCVAPDVLLSGTIVDPTGAPVPLALVAVWTADGTRRLAHIASDERGEFTVTESGRGGEDPLPAGTALRVNVQQLIRPSSRTAFTHALGTRAGITLGARDVRIEVPAPKVPSATLAGRLVIDGGFLPAHLTLRVRRAASRWSPGVDFDTATGVFQLGPVLPGEYVVEVADGEHVVFARSGIVLAADATTDVGRLAVGAGGHVHVTTDADVSTLKNVRVEALGRSNQRVELVRSGMQWTTRHPLEPGTWSVQIVSETWSSGTVQVEVVHGEAVQVLVEGQPERR